MCDRGYRAIWLSVLLLAGLLQGCAGRYFTPVAAPHEPSVHALSQWPYHDLWTGIVFNGAKVGFSHLAVTVADGVPGLYRIESEASLQFHFLGFGKTVRLRAVDVVDENLHLVRLDAAHHLDGNDLVLKGTASPERIDLTVDNNGHRTERSIALNGAVVPTSALLMYPVLHGLEVGREYRYQAFNGETLTVSEVVQRVEAFERSELFTGQAYRIETRFHGQKTTSWIDPSGRPLFELALNGVMISALEEEAAAKRYLVTAALNKQDVMLDFSMVAVARPIPTPRALTRLSVLLDGEVPAPPSAGSQQCTPAEGGWHCTVDIGRPLPGAPGEARHLLSSLTVPHGHPKIRALAGRIAQGAEDPREIIGRIVDWLSANVRSHPADSFSALDVLESGRAECQGHAYLYTALARANGIPSRVMNGLVYSAAHDAFLFHSWTESLVDGRWIAVDPTFGQIPADATHLRIAEGEEAADLLPLIDWVGRLSVKILDFSDGH